jgi:hypothetical protein
MDKLLGGRWRSEPGRIVRYHILSEVVAAAYRRFGLVQLDTACQSALCKLADLRNDQLIDLRAIIMLDAQLHMNSPVRMCIPLLESNAFRMTTRIPHDSSHP